MSTIRIEFNTDNASFEDNGIHEIDHILSQVRKMVSMGIGHHAPLHWALLWDSNGNNVGSVTISEEE